MKKKAKWRVLLTWLLAIALITNSLPYQVWAADDKPEENTRGSHPLEDQDGIPVYQRKDLKVGELIDQRTENTKLFYNENGTFTKKVYHGPIHRKVQDKWENIDKTLEKQSDNTITTKNTDLSIGFAPKMENGEYVQVQEKEQKLTYSLLRAEGKDKEPLTAADAKATTNKNEILYQDVFPHTDLRNRTFNKLVKEDIVLREPTGYSKFVFELQTDLVPEPQEDGSILFKNGKETVYIVKKPYMFDSNFDEESGESVRSDKVRYKIEPGQEKGKYEFTVEADEAWLSDPARVYPVYIDPSTLRTYDSTDTYVSDRYPRQNYDGDVDDKYGYAVLKVGYYEGAGNNEAFLNFDVDDLKGATIEQADLMLYAFHTYSTSPTIAYLDQVNGAWNASSLTWANKPSSSTLATSNNAVRGQWTNFGVTRQVQEWSSGKTPNHGVKLYTYKNDRKYWKKFAASEEGDDLAPHLDITFSYKAPNKPAVQAYTHDDGTGKGYIDVSWDPVPGATQYRVLLFNGWEYQSFWAGNNTTWSSRGKGIFPTQEMLNKGQYELCLNGEGEELSINPAEVYNNAIAAGTPHGTTYKDRKHYFVRIEAHFPLGESPGSVGENPYLPLNNPTNQTVIAQANMQGQDSGYVELTWTKAKLADGYKILMYNGQDYVEFDAGNTDRWTTQGKNIWPTASEIAAGHVQLHTDGKGTELPVDPTPVYQKVQSPDAGNPVYKFKIKAYSKSGNPDSTPKKIHEAVIPSANQLLGMEDYWSSIEVQYGKGKYSERQSCSGRERC